MDGVRLGQAMATLPVQLEIDRDQILAQLQLEPWGGAGEQRAGGIGLALGLAWSCLGLAAVAGAFCCTA